MSTTAPVWLIVDDDEVFATTLARGLERHGQQCVVAHDAATALAQALATKPAHVVLDMKLGAESGLSLLPELRSILPTARIQILTGFASIATAVRALKNGADDYLPKPVQVRQLLAKANESLATAPSEPTAEIDPPRPLSPRRLEWEHIQRVLDECAGNISAAARQLGLHRRSLQRKLAKRPAPR